jgi:gamma-glutamylcysteine synthetase
MANEFPLPIARFLTMIKGTEDEVYSKLLIKRHGKTMAVLESEWRDLLAKLKSE